MQELELISVKKIIRDLKKDILTLYKYKLQFNGIFLFIKTFQKNRYFEEISKDYNDFLRYLSYIINTKESILKFLKKNKKGINEVQFNLLRDLYTEISIFENKIIVIANNVVGLIKSYNNNYYYFPTDNNKEILLSKKNIDNYMNEIRI